MYTLEYLRNNKVGVICNNYSEWFICKDIINHQRDLPMEFEDGIIFRICPHELLLGNFGCTNISSNSYELDGFEIIESSVFIRDIRNNKLLEIL
jgi:hypothetical protein